MIVTIIAATAENKALGKNNDLVWDLPADMQFFKDTTRGHAVITGRRNYESIPEKYRPLKGRTNIVVSNNPNYPAPGAVVVTDLQNALQVAESQGESEVFIIGGGQIYALALEENVVDKMYLTHVHGEFDADVFFPHFDPINWTKEEVLYHPADEKHACAFTIFKYLRKKETV